MSGTLFISPVRPERILGSSKGHVFVYLLKVVYDSDCIAVTSQCSIVVLFSKLFIPLLFLLLHNGELLLLAPTLAHPALKKNSPATRARYSQSQSILSPVPRGKARRLPFPFRGKENYVATYSEY